MVSRRGLSVLMFLSGHGVRRWPAGRLVFGQLGYGKAGRSK